MKGFTIKANIKETLGDAIKKHPQKFPHTISQMVRWGDTAVSQWQKLVKNSYKGRGQPGWWVRNYLGVSGNRIRWKFLDNEPLAVKVYHNNKGAKYNFGRAIEQGRPRYNQKLALYTSKKVRISKKGYPYLVIPIAQAGLSDSPDFLAKKVGEKRETAITKEPVIRNMYSYDRLSSGGNLAEFHQIDKLGRHHRTQVQWLTMSEKSKGWFYPPIQGFAYSEAVGDAIKQGRAKITTDGGQLNFDHSIAQAIAKDIALQVKK